MKDTLVKRFVIGTFVSLYALVSVISTIHVIDFFELSNPYWLAVTLAIGFEIGAAASLASLVILKKMNKTIVWSLFIAITLMQMQGNMYYAFINLTDFNSWSELFNLIEEDVIDQKRILAFVSGAILPLIALGFIKSLVDYIKPEGEDEDDLISEGILGNINSEEDLDGFETKPSDEFFEDILDKPINKNSFANIDKEEELEAWDDISKGLGEEYDAYVDRHEPGSWLKNPSEEFADTEEELTEELDATLNDGLEDDELIGEYFEQKAQQRENYETDELLNQEHEDEDLFDEAHALDQAMNDMVSDFTDEDVNAIIDAVESPNDPIETLVDAAEKYKETLPEQEEINPTSVGSIVQKLETPHLPQEEPKVKSEDQLWKEAMDKKAKEEMEAFIKRKNANK